MTGSANLKALFWFTIAMVFMLMALIVQQTQFKSWLEDYDLFVYLYRFNTACVWLSFIIFIIGALHLDNAKKHYDNAIFSLRVIGVMAFFHVMATIFNLSFYTHYYFIYGLCLLLISGWNIRELRKSY